MSSLSFNKQADGSFAVYDADAQLFGYIQENDDHTWSTVSDTGKAGKDTYNSQHEAGAALAPDRISAVGSGTGSGAVTQDGATLKRIQEGTAGDRWGDTSTPADVDVTVTDTKADKAATNK